MRLEAIDPSHADTVALVRGPLVLFALAENPRAVSRQALLAAEQVSGQTATWQAQTASGKMLLRPFFAINDEPYQTYLQVS